MRRTTVAVIGVVAYGLGRRRGIDAGEDSMRMLSERLSVARVRRYQRSFYKAQLAKASYERALGESRTEYRALEDRARGMAAMVKVIAGRLAESVSRVDAVEARELLRSAAALSEVADANVG